MQFELSKSILHNHRLGIPSVAISENYFAISSEKDVLISQVLKNSKVLRLQGHHSPVTHLCFSGCGTKVISVAQDYVIEWIITCILEQDKNGEQLRGKVLCDSRNRCYALCASVERDIITVMYSNCFDVLSLKTGKLVNCVDEANLLNCAFFSSSEIVFLLASGAIFLWNILEQKYTAKSKPLCFSETAVTNVTVFSQSIVIGTDIGKIFCFKKHDESIEKAFVVDIDALFVRNAIREKSQSISDLTHIRVYDISFATNPHKDVEEKACLLYCATDRAILSLNPVTQEVEVLNCDGHDTTTSCFENAALFVTEKQVCCVAASLFKRSVEIFNSFIVTTTAVSNIGISFISDQPLLPTSILNSRLQPKKKIMHHPNKAVRDKPVTFKSNVRSSGYTSAPRMKMFTPVIQKSKNVQQKSNTTKPKKKFEMNKVKVDWGNPITHPTTVKLSERECIINMLSISAKNEICAAMGDSSLHVLRQKSTKHKTLSGHSGSVLSCNWSNCGRFIITSSTDATACIWQSTDSDKPVLLVDNMCHNFPEKNNNNVKFLKDISHAQFYYLDNFFILTCGNSMKIYKYYVDEEVNDLKRYSNKSRYKIIQDYESTNAQIITSIAAPNNMYSYIILSTASDKSLSIHDMNVGTVLTTLTDVHTRPVHALSHTTGTPMEQCENMNLFATAAVSDGIKLWDIRSQKPILKLSSHPNNTKCDLSISPCGMYLVTATDNREIAIYDIRKRSMTQKISKLKDKASAVTFGLTSSKVYCGLQNGELNVFSQ